VLDGIDQSLDILSTRYVFLPKSLADSTVANDENLKISLGSGCGTQQFNSTKLQVPAKLNVTAVSIVSSLGCSTRVPNNAEVLRILITDANGKVVTQSLRAGRDTSEWAYSCSDVLPLMQHQQAPVFESFPVVRESFPTCEGHRYVTTLTVDKLSNVKSLELEWIGSSGMIDIQKVSLIDHETKQIYPITKMSTSLADTNRWRHVEDINETSVYENLRAMPRAWLVPELVSASSDQILNAIKTSKLPDGRFFNSSKIALVRNPLRFKAENEDVAATANVVNLSDTEVEVKTNSSSPAFLVLSDVYYPGWKAKIDEKNVQLFQTNYVLRGVLVPSGEHVVKFEFKSTSFHLGVGISFASLVLLGYLYFRLMQHQKSRIAN
jgi:hypothetical protein